MPAAWTSLRRDRIEQRFGFGDCCGQDGVGKPRFGHACNLAFHRLRDSNGVAQRTLDIDDGDPPLRTFDVRDPASDFARRMPCSCRCARSPVECCHVVPTPGPVRT